MSVASVFISKTPRPRPALVAVLLINKIPDDFRRGPGFKQRLRILRFV